MAQWTIWLDNEVIHKPVTTERNVTAATLSLALDSAGSLEVDVPVTHPAYATVASLPPLGRAVWRVERDGAEVFRGRTLSRTREPIDGRVRVIVEGELAMLNDSLRTPYEFSGSPSAYLRMLIENHNAQVEPWKRFSVGTVDIVDKGGNDYIVRGSESNATTWEELLNKTVKSSDAGHLTLTPGTRTLGWRANVTTAATQPVRLGWNLLGMQDEVDGNELCSAILPLGKANDDGQRLTIASTRTGGAGVTVRDGILVNDALAAEHGTIVREVVWDDVTLEPNLWSRALAAAQALSTPRAVHVDAIDMSDAGYDVGAFDVGQLVELDALDTQGRMQVTGIEWDLLDPAGGGIDFGDAQVTSSARSASTQSTATSALYVAGSASSGGGTNPLPAGGAAGQVLAKASATDYDVAWVTPDETAGTTVNLSNIGSGTKTLTLTRVGNLVHASMTATATASAANSAISCGTVPSGYRPAQAEFQSGACVTGNTLSGDYRWRVATSGAVTYWCSTTVIRESPLCMTWVTSDSFPS